MARVAAHDEDALLEIYERSHRAVFTLLLRMTHSREQAEELTVEVYQALRHGASHWRPDQGLVLTWLVQRAHSLALQQTSRARSAYRARHDRGGGNFHFHMPDYRNLLALRALEQKLGAGLAALGPDARRTFEAVYFERQSYRGAADALGLAPGAVLSAVHAAGLGLARAVGIGVQVPSPCPQAELASALGLDVVPAEETARIEAHVASCERCAGGLATARALAGALVAWPTDLLRPSGSVRAKLGSGRAAAAGVVDRWQWVGSEISCSMLTTDPETRTVGLLVRLVPGGNYPPHTHAGVEELFLLSGQLWINEQLVYPGQYVRAPPGTRDHRVWSETGCSCVLITSTDDALGGS